MRQLFDYGMQTYWSLAHSSAKKMHWFGYTDFEKQHLGRLNLVSNYDCDMSTREAGMAHQKTRALKSSSSVFAQTSA